MRRLLLIGVGVALTAVIVHQVARAGDRQGISAQRFSPAGIADSATTLARNIKGFGTRFRASMAHHEDTLRARLLPDEESLAKARETRASARGRNAAERPDDPDTADVFPDDGTEYF